MYDNNIKLLELNTLKHKIESLEIITESNQLIAIVKLHKASVLCPIFNSEKIKFNSYRLKKIVHSISTQKPCIIHFKQR